MSTSAPPAAHAAETVGVATLGGGTIVCAGVDRGALARR